MPVRIAVGHVVHNGWVFDLGYQLFKHFISDKMKERIFLHGSNMESLHKYIDQDRLPEWYAY